MQGNTEKRTFWRGLPRPDSMGEAPRMLGIGGGLAVGAMLLLILSQQIEAMDFFLQAASTLLLGIGLTFVSLYWAVRVRSFKEPFGIYAGFLIGTLGIWGLDVIGLLDIWNDFLSSLLVNLLGSVLMFGLFYFLLRTMGLTATAVNTETALVSIEDSPTTIAAAE